MLTLSTLISDMAQRLAADANMNSWCTTNYGRAAKIMINLDERNPPEAAQCPYIAAYPFTQDYGREKREQLLAFMVECCLYDENFRLYADSDIIEYKGVQNVEALRRYVDKALGLLSLGNGIISGVASEYSTIETFPFFTCYMLVQIREPLTIGVDPLA